MALSPLIYSVIIQLSIFWGGGGVERMQEVYEFGKGYVKLVCTLDTYGVSHVAPKGKDCCLVPHLSIPQCTFRFLLHQRLKTEDSCLCVFCLGH